MLLPRRPQRLLTECGLEVEWIRPRTALPERAVRETLLADPDAMGDLVISELRLAAAQAGRGIRGAAGGQRAQARPLAGVNAGASLVLLLAGHAARHLGADLEPGVRDLLLAVDALAVRAGVDALERLAR